MPMFCFSNRLCRTGRLQRSKPCPSSARPSVGWRGPDWPRKIGGPRKGALGNYLQKTQMK